MKNIKQRHELEAYAWKIYPNDSTEHMIQRAAMIRAYEFITGKVDQEEREKAKISQQIQELMKQKGL